MRWLLLIIAFWIVTTSRALGAEPTDRPNILWIFVEDLSPFFGCYDDPSIATIRRPSID